jgi:hypothetical protein
MMRVIMVFLVGFGAFLGFFQGLIAAITHGCIRSDSDLFIVSPEMDLIITGVCLGIAWLIGYFQKDTFAFRGVGTKFYGRESIEQGYIATKWLAAIIPLLPIRSYIIHYKVNDFSKFDFETQKNVMIPVQGYFHFPQMFRTALISYGMILWSLACLWLMFMSPCF